MGGKNIDYQNPQHFRTRAQRKAGRQQPNNNKTKKAKQQTNERTNERTDQPRQEYHPGGAIACFFRDRAVPRIGWTQQRNTAQPDSRENESARASEREAQHAAQKASRNHRVCWCCRCRKCTHCNGCVTHRVVPSSQNRNKNHRH